jgi:phage terminase small subunit
MDGDKVRLTTARIDGLRSMSSCEKGLRIMGRHLGCMPPSRSNLSTPEVPG